MPSKKRRTAERWTPPKPHPDTPDLTMSLPAELRNTIYEEVLLFDRTVDLNSDPRRPWYRRGQIGFALLHLSKEIRREALSVFWSRNEFIIHLHESTKSSFERLAEVLGDVAQTCGVVRFPSLKVWIRDHTVWTKLTAMLPLLEIMRQTGLDIGTEESKTSYDQAMEQGSAAALKAAASKSIFNMKDPTSVFAQQVLEQAIRVGRRATSKGWSREKLRKEYADFVTKQTLEGRGRAAVLAKEKRKAKEAKKEAARDY